MLGDEGLSWSVDEQSLKDAFSSFGEITEGTNCYTLSCHSKFLILLEQSCLLISVLLSISCDKIADSTPVHW